MWTPSFVTMQSILTIGMNCTTCEQSFTCAFPLTLNFNMMLMVTQTKMQRVYRHLFYTFTMGTTLKFTVNGNAYVTCEWTFRSRSNSRINCEALSTIGKRNEEARDFNSQTRIQIQCNIVVSLNLLQFGSLSAYWMSKQWFHNWHLILIP